MSFYTSVPAAPAPIQTHVTPCDHGEAGTRELTLGSSWAVPVALPTQSAGAQGWPGAPQGQHQSPAAVSTLHREETLETGRAVNQRA